MSTPVKAIPEGMHSITPHLTCAGAAEERRVKLRLHTLKAYFI